MGPSQLFSVGVTVVGVGYTQWFCLPTKLFCVIFNIWESLINTGPSQLCSICVTQWLWEQSLKKNTSFRAFALDMNEVLTELTTLGVLTTEQRVKRSRVRNEPGAGDNTPNFRDTRETFFKLLYDDNNDRHIFWTVFRLFFLDRPFVNHRFDCGEEVNYI